MCRVPLGLLPHYSHGTSAVFCCHVTEYHNHSGLQHAATASHFPWVQGPGTAEPRFLLTLLQGCSKGARQRALSCGGPPGKESASGSLRVLAVTCGCVTEVTRFHWLLTRDCPQDLQAACSSFASGFPTWRCTSPSPSPGLCSCCSCYHRVLLYAVEA